MSTVKPTQLITAALVGSPDPALLDQAARHAALRRATVRTRELPAPAPAPGQEPDQPSSAFAATVSMVLARPAAMRDPILVEALEQLATAGLVLPVKLLVPLLVAAGSSRDIAARLPAVLGRRGRWLAQLDSDWLRHQAIAAPDPLDWEEGSLAERIAWLRHLRAADPAAGRELVQQARSEKAVDRAQFVAALEVGLGPGDEELLEVSLRDRSKQVGRAAAGLLARLDGSAYLTRVLELARGCFSLRDKPRKGLLSRLRAPEQDILAAAPPEQDLVAGFYADVAATQVVKGPAGRVQLLAAMMPPHRWAELGISVAGLGAGVLCDDEHIDVAQALTCAAIRWGNTEAARVLLTRHLDPALLPLLPATERDTVLVKIVHATTPKELPGLCSRLLAQQGLRLSREAAGVILDGIFAHAKTKNTVPEAPARLLAFAAEPSAASGLLPRLTLLGQQPGLSTFNQRIARDAAAALTLRQGIHESINQPEETR